MASDQTMAILNKTLRELTEQVAELVEQLRLDRKEADQHGNRGS